MRCATCSGCISLAAEVVLGRRRLAVTSLVFGALALAACHAESADPTDTVGEVVIESAPTTLLPVVVDTEPPDVSTTLPQGLLFGGDLCSALTADDFARVPIDGNGTGDLIDQTPLSDDTCGYQLQLGRIEVTIMVQARQPSDFEVPGADGSAPEPVSGIGLEANVRELLDGTFDVIVHVDNGWFSVNSLDVASAVEFARRAVDRVAG